MGKSDQHQTKKGAHKATDGESKHKNKPSFDTLGSSPFETTFKDNDGGFYQSQWRDRFRQLCDYKVQFGHCLVPQHYSANPKLGHWVAKQRARYRKITEENTASVIAERIRALDGIGFDWGTSKTDLASIWSVRFHQLCEFRGQFGHCLVPQRYSANPKLGVWVRNQRSNCMLHQEGKPSPMTTERIRGLESIGFFQEGNPSPMTAERIRGLESVGFKYETFAVFWNECFEQLREFKVKFGNCFVPQHYSASPKLGQWVSTQRSNYRLYQEGKPSPMTAELIRELESLGFEWETTAGFWNERFEELREFKVQFGHCLVSIRYSANPKLGKWVSTQRSNYHFDQEGKTSPMTADHVRELESLGFKWGQTSVSWNARFEQLREFKAQLGHCFVPIMYSANPKLGLWVSTQRRNYRLYQQGKTSPMTAERVRELESLGFEWETTAVSWNERFEQLREFKEQLGHCLVPIKYSANPKLGVWVSNQRHNYNLYQEGKTSPMTAERIRELESLGFKWGQIAVSWNERIEQLRGFKAQFGHFLVPIKYSANPKLGQWVSTQRSNYRLYQEGKASTMTAERIRELESHGFKWRQNPFSWSERFEQLREFKAQFGHCLVPIKYSTNPKLGQWVSTQRSNYRWYQEGKPSPMTAYHVRELESLGFKWGQIAVSWNERFEQLREFKVQFGHCAVPQHYSANLKLGTWVSNQRRNYNLYQEGNPSPMTAERIRELESVEFKLGRNSVS